MSEEDLSKRLKGKTPVEYLRVSSQAQKLRGSGVKSQKEAIRHWLKDNGIRKKPKVFQDVGSGGDESGSRKGWKEMIDWVLSQKKPSDFFVIMRDFNRWSRHVFYGPEAAARLFRAGVEIVSVADNAATGTQAVPDEHGEFMFGLWTALGSRERTGSRKRVKAGTDRARDVLGVIGGQPMDLSGQFRALMEQEAGLRAGFVSYAGFGRSLKPKRGRSWMVKTMDKFDRMRAFAEKEGIADIMGDWLKVVDMNRGVKEKHGPKSKQFLAVQKMTSGFIKKPEEFWQFKPAAEQYAEWVKNPDEYQASRGR